MTNKGKMIEAVYAASLTKRATLVIFYLINRSNDELTCFPSVKTIGNECNMSMRTVQRALNDLEAAGFVSKESRFYECGGQRSNFFSLSVPTAISDDSKVEKPDSSQSESKQINTSHRDCEALAVHAVICERMEVLCDIEDENMDKEIINNEFPIADDVFMSVSEDMETLGFKDYLTAQNDIKKDNCNGYIEKSSNKGMMKQVSKNIDSEVFGSCRFNQLTNTYSCNCEKKAYHNDG